MSAYTFYLNGWNAWAPGLPTRDHWLAWLPEGGPLEELEAKPACKAAKPIWRRRYSLSSRMLIDTSLNLCETLNVDPTQTHLIYGAENGETPPFIALLKDLTVSSRLSPTAFSNSVHHVPTGHFGMLAKHKGLSRTISAFQDTFICSVLDMVGLFSRMPELPTLLVIADQFLEEPFDCPQSMTPFPYGVSFLFSAEPRCEEEKPLHLRIKSQAAANEGPHEEPVFNFLRWLRSDEPRLEMNTSFGVVEWSR